MEIPEPVARAIAAADRIASEGGFWRECMEVVRAAVAGDPMPEDQDRAALLLDHGALLLGRALFAEVVGA